MNNKSIPLDYSNGVMFELEKAFWDERGKGARFRMMNVGKEFYKNNVLPLIKSGEIDDILLTIGSLLKDKGIVSTVTYNSEDRLLRVSVKGCVHRQVEDQMITHGIEPFTCIPANIIIMAIEEKLDRQVELAEIKVDEGVCQLLLIVFEKRPAVN
jgi:hypothetical protein